MNRLLMSLFSAAILMIALPCGAAMAEDVQPKKASRSGLAANFDQMFSHKLAEANGIRLHYVIGGPTDGEMVILLHGWPQTWYTWRRVMPALARAGYHVFAVDYRGAGETEKPQGG